MIKEFRLDANIKVSSSSTISKDELNVVSLLYGPLIKTDALCLYLTLSSILARSDLEANFIQKELLRILGFDSTRFYHARIKLEAIGLLSTYQNGESFLLLIKAPLTAKQFMTDGVLGMYLYSEIGDNQFKKIQKLFELPKFDKSLYQEITSSFDEVFESTDNKKIADESYLLDHKINHGITINNYNFDFNLFISLISQTFLEGKRITKRFETYIINLAYAYMFNEEDMKEIYNTSLNTSGFFDYTLCSKKAREKYALTHVNSLPSINEKEEAKMDKTEDLFQSITANILIESSTGVKVADPLDVEKVSNLYINFSSLPRSVINACVAYAIKKCDGKVPAYKYFETIIKDWVVKGVVTFKQARDILFKDSNESSKKTRKSTDPDWLKEYVANFENRVEDL